MKKSTAGFLSSLFLLLLGGVTHGQSETVDLYLQPNTRAEKVDRVSLDDPRLGQATPVLDESLAALGWHFAEFTDTINGFVPDAKIGKDLLPVNDAIVYSRPSTESPVLAVYRTGDDIEILDTGAWWKLRLETGFPVYFLLDSPPPLPEVTGIADDALVELTPSEPTSPMIDETPVVDTSPPPSTPLRIDQKPAPPPPPDVIGQPYQGVFKRSKKVLGLFAPKADFYLEDMDGGKIAWVDTSGIVVPGSLKSFLGESVIIHGERELLDSKDWIIRARNMRLK